MRFSCGAVVLATLVGSLSGCAATHPRMDDASAPSDCGHHCQRCCDGLGCIDGSACESGRCLLGFLCDAGAPPPRVDAGHDTAPPFADAGHD